MNDPAGERFPEELQTVVTRLRAERVEVDALQLDEIKQRALRRARSRTRGPVFLRSRVTTVFTSLALIGGTGGALAIANGSSNGGPAGSAARAQYTPAKGCGADATPCPGTQHQVTQITVAVMHLSSSYNKAVSQTNHLVGQVHSPQIRRQVRMMLAKARRLNRAANRLLSLAKAEKSKDPLKALKLIVQARAKMAQAKADATKAKKTAAHAARLGL